jgi:hypothetical protein
MLQLALLSELLLSCLVKQKAVADSGPDKFGTNDMQHTCSNCRSNFEISNATRQKSALGFNFTPWRLVSPTKSLDDYQKVTCPRCGHIDIDDQLRVFGIFRPRLFFYLFIALILFLLVLDILGYFPGQK